MAKHRSHKRKHNYKGGALGNYPASSWGWTMGTLGNGWTQFMNSLSLQPGQNMSAAQTNNIVPNSQGNVAAGSPNMNGGRHRRRHRRTAKRGGNIGAVLSQAAVPGALLILNQTAKRRHRRR